MSVCVHLCYVAGQQNSYEKKKNKARISNFKGFLNLNGGESGQKTYKIMSDLWLSSFLILEIKSFDMQCTTQFFETHFKNQASTTVM